MKISIKNILVLILPIMIIGSSMTSCEDPESVGADAQVSYIRVTDPAASDSLLVGAFLGNLVAIMGENMGSVREVWFNDQKAVLNPAFITDRSILVNVPNNAPTEITDKIYMHFRDGTVYEHNFVVNIPPPVISAMSNEYASIGAEAKIYGQYFFDPVPIVVEFTATAGGTVTAEISDVMENELTIVIPDGAGVGPITVTTNFGTIESSLYYLDNRNIFLNYDDKAPINTWRTGGPFINDAHSIDGNYIRFRGVYDASAQRVEGPDVPNAGDVNASQWWAEVSGAPEGNLLPGEAADYVLKFEAKVITWDQSYLNICFAPWGHKDSNQEYWSNDFNARAIWGPWEENGEAFTTDGEWRTFAIPMTDFKWAMGTDDDENVEYTDHKFDKNVTGSMSMWMLGTALSSNSPFEVYMDNLRIVEK